MTTNSKNNETHLTQKDLNKVFRRSLTMEASWGFERMMNMGYCYAMIPVIKKVYKDNKDRAEALVRHWEFFNITPHISTLTLGISASMEEANANSKDFDTNAINAAKASLMGPLSGIGDAIFQSALRIIAAGLGISFSMKGSIIGPILFLLAFNVPHFIVRWLCLKYGYKMGTDLFSKIGSTNIMQKLTYGVSILGLMVIGGMSASMVYLKIPIQIGAGKFAQPLQNTLDSIMPNLIPLTIFGIMYWLVKKNFKATWILIGILIVSIIGAYFGIFAA